MCIFFGSGFPCLPDQYDLLPGAVRTSSFLALVSLVSLGLDIPKCVHRVWFGACVAFKELKVGAEVGEREQEEESSKAMHFQPIELH